jgi:hypothetical protein
VEPHLPLHIEPLDQLSATGALESPGYRETIIQKLERLWDYCAHLPNGTMVLVSDCDIQFFRPFAANLASHLDDCDIVFQTNRVRPELKLNGGFYCLRLKPCTRSLLDTVIQITPGFRHDESAYNWLLRRTGFPIRFRLLPPEDYWTHMSTGIPGFNANLAPLQAYMHHANNTGDVPARLEALAAVRARLMPPLSSVA